VVVVAVVAVITLLVVAAAVEAEAAIEEMARKKNQLDHVSSSKRMVIATMGMNAFTNMEKQTRVILLS